MYSAFLSGLGSSRAVFNLEDKKIVALTLASKTNGRGRGLDALA